MNKFDLRKLFKPPKNSEHFDHTFTFLKIIISANVPRTNTSLLIIFN